jgi:hypothetical protein
MDKIRIYRGTTVRNFAGLDTVWGAYYDASGTESSGENPTYKIVDVTRDSTWWYDAGKPIWMLKSPEGITFVMQSVTDHSGGYEGLDTLDERLVNLPEGWSYHKTVLDRDLSLNGITADDGTENAWKVMQDEFHNSYSGCWINSAGERSCNFDPLSP